MWELGNRGILVLISVSIGCALLYNAWGPILALTLSLGLVVHVCYSLLTNDSILSPHTLLAFEYTKQAGQDLKDNLKTTSLRFARTSREFLRALKARYNLKLGPKMSGYRKNAYQLSNDICDASRFELSPVHRSGYSDLVTDNGAENTPYGVSSIGYSFDASGVEAKVTSTPMGLWRKETSGSPNGGIGLFGSGSSRRPRGQLFHGQNHTLSRGEDVVFSPEGSPWGTSISPRMRAKAGGVKTVQTVAGPLLASTRYNIDSKVYSDVTSPGLSTRLAKYATEANNKLTHQSQYTTGQFPKVNLSVSPVPLINMKNKKVRTPVTVRIAPPEATRYSPPERQRILSETCTVESPTGLSVVQVLRDISLKRHASREDVSLDLVKKQRTDSLYGSDNLDILEEMTQKRAREDSPKSEEDNSPKSTTCRPTKRTKTPSCYDVLNSLSSSINVSSGIKRKASTLDLSRSGTPDLEKHFKSSEAIPAAMHVSLPVLPEPQTEVIRCQKRGLDEKYSQNTDASNSNKKLQEQAPSKGILKTTANKQLMINQNTDHSQGDSANVREVTKIKTKEPLSINKPINSTEKLFMRAEPQGNEKLRTMIQEQGNIRAKFTTDDMEEIRKEDIVMMRQTSMRARLQSMFDAISGKAASKINPDVVIQAEEVDEPTAIAVTPTSLTTLNSSTSTTNTNKSPIATSAIAPNFAESKPKTTPAKHVTFNLPTPESAQSTESCATKSITSSGLKAENGNSPHSEAPKLNFTAPTISSTPAVAISTTPLSLNASNPITTTTTLSFGGPLTTPVSPKTTAPTLQTTLLSFGTPSASTAAPVATAVTFSGLNAAKSTTANSSMSGHDAMVTSHSSPAVQNITTSTLLTKMPANGVFSAPTVGANSVNFSFDSNKTAQNPTTTSQPSSNPAPNFSFGSAKASAAPAFGNINATSSPAQNQPAASGLSFGVSSTTSMTPSFNGSNQVISAAPTSNITPVMSSTVPAATTSVFSFGTSTTTPQTSKIGGFQFGSTGNTNTNQSTSNQAFGNTAAPAQNIPSFGTTTVTTGSTFTFGTSAPAAPGFGVTKNPTTTSEFVSSAPTPGFSFGAPAAATKPGFSFGTNVASTAASTSVAPAFGTASSTAIPAFGAPSTTTVSQPFGSAITTSAFGSTTSAPAFGTPNTSQPSFGGTPSTVSSSAFGTPKTSAQPAFGSNNNTPTFKAATATTSLFAPPSSNASANANAITTATPTFGGNTSIFGQAKSPPAFGAASSAFGSNVTPTFGAQTSTTSAFGSINPVTCTATSGFGTSNTATRAFGALAPTASAQNTIAPAFGASGSAFGASTSAPPAFGVNTSTTSYFGSSATTSFGAQTQANVPFVAANNNPVPSAVNFSSNAASPFGTQSAASAFAAPNSTAPPPYGATNTNANATFSFGGSQTQTQQNPAFSFGGSNTGNNNTAGGPAPFQFGSAPPKQELPAGGFSFIAPSSTSVPDIGASDAPSFGAPAPGSMFNATPAPTGGMFSIGTGSTAPRSRPSRIRRQR